VPRDDLPPLPRSGDLWTSPPTPLDLVLEAEQSTILAREIQTLPDRQRDAALAHAAGLNLEDIARHWGKSRERVRQVLARALRTMRHPSRSDALRDRELRARDPLPESLEARMLDAAKRIREDAADAARRKRMARALMFASAACRARPHLQQREAPVPLPATERVRLDDLVASLTALVAPRRGIAPWRTQAGFDKAMASARRKLAEAQRIADRDDKIRKMQLPIGGRRWRTS
jgi:hypothetical protein